MGYYVEFYQTDRLRVFFENYVIGFILAHYKAFPMDIFGPNNCDYTYWVLLPLF